MFVLKFLWQFPLRMLAYIKNNPRSVISMIIGLYFGLCTIYFDVINQNNNNFFSLPYQFLFAQKNEITLDQLTGENIGIKTAKTQSPKQNNLYLFVLDVSSSMNKVNPNSHLHTKYVEGIAEVNYRFGFGLIHAKSPPNRMDLAKVRLYELLMELLSKKRENSTDAFAIWTLGDKGRLIYPSNKKITIEPNSIKNAILTIDPLKQDTNVNANYVSLFDKFTNVYKDELTENQLNQSKAPFFIITVLSDLLPDQKKQYKARIKRLDQNWEELEEKIEQISHPNTIVNMVVFSEDEPDNQKTILPLLERNIETFKINKFFMADKTDILYTIRKSRASIKFYYTTSYELSETSFMIKSTSDEANQVKIDLPAAVDRITLPKITLYCEKLGAIGDGIGQIKRIRSGGSPFRADLYKNQKIKLSLKEGPFSPNPHPAPILRLTIDNKKETLLIPVTFVRTFPGWISIMFILLQFFLLLSIVLKIIPWYPGVPGQDVVDDYIPDHTRPYPEEKKIKKERRPKTRKDTILVFIFPLIVLTSLIYILGHQVCPFSKASGKDIVPPLSSVEEVEEKLSTAYNTNHFKIMRYTSDELVKDYKGIYYWIDIKDAVTQETIKFELGEYTIEHYNKKFLESINKFADEVLKKLKDKVPHKIFINGHADKLGNETFNRNFDPEFIPGKIEYYRKLKGGGSTKFIPNFKKEEVKEPIFNKDLPNLRAAFIRKKFHELYKEERGLSTILDGEVVLEISEKFRNAILILWIKWPEKTK